MNRLKRLIVPAAMVLSITTVYGAEEPNSKYSGLVTARSSDGKVPTNGDTDSPMFLDPYLPPYTYIKIYHPDLEDLWLRAMHRPDLETRRQAVRTIGQAHLHGMPGLQDTATHIIKVIQNADTDRLLRQAAIQTLCRLDARQSADILLDKQKHGLSEILLSDIALAGWGHEPARAVWIRRLTDPTTPWAARASAIRALTTVRHEAAADTLKQMPADRSLDATKRLVAAQALGEIVTEGWEDMAQDLAAGSMIDRLVSAKLLAHHGGDRAVRLLLELAVDREPSIAAVALQRLLEIDPLLISPFGNDSLKHADSKIRRLGAEAIFFQNMPAAIHVLAPLLNDLNPGVRQYVRRSLIEQYKMPHLRQSIHEATMTVLRHEDWRDLSDLNLSVRIKSEWRGLEQAVRVLGVVDHKPAADDLVDLMSYPRVEVRQTAAVALRRLGIERTLASLLDYARRATDWGFTGNSIAVGDPNLSKGIKDFGKLDEQIAQILQFFGVMKYAPAESLMRRHIPRCDPGPGPGFQSRSAAIWSLGHLYENNPDPELAQKLVERLNDIYTLPPENTIVRSMSAISIARMQAKDHMESLNTHYELEQRYEVIGQAVRWAIEHITGQRLEDQLPFYTVQQEWLFNATREINDDKFMVERGMEQYRIIPDEQRKAEKQG